MNAFTVRCNRRLEDGISTTNGQVVLGTEFVRTANRKVVFFSKSLPPPAISANRIMRVRPVKEFGSVVLTDATTLFPGGTLVRIFGNKVTPLNSAAIMFAGATGFVGPRWRSKVDVLVWFKAGGQVLVDFGQYKCREVISMVEDQPVLQRYCQYGSNTPR